MAEFTDSTERLSESAPLGACRTLGCDSEKAAERVQISPICRVNIGILTKKPVKAGEIWTVQVFLQPPILSPTGSQDSGIK